MQNKSTAKHIFQSTQNEVWITEYCSPLHLHDSQDHPTQVNEMGQKKNFLEDLSSEAEIGLYSHPIPLGGGVEAHEMKEEEDETVCVSAHTHITCYCRTISGPPCRCGGR